MLLLLLVLQALSAAADLQLCSFAACGTCSQFKSQQHVGRCSLSLSLSLCLPQQELLQLQHCATVNFEN